MHTKKCPFKSCGLNQGVQRHHSYKQTGVGDLQMDRVYGYDTSVGFHDDYGTSGLSSFRGPLGSIIALDRLVLPSFETHE